MDPGFDIYGIDKREIGNLLVAWFEQNKRNLPWRNHSSVYCRLVSEMMLQQTQVATVIPYFLRWMKIFPTIFDLARAPEAKALKLWEGLGYYIRAKNLHKTAQEIVAQQNQNKNFYPESPQNWRTFPGIGEYTANALASIAQNQHVAAIDGNVVRVLCRINGIQTIFTSKDQAIKEVKTWATKYIPSGKSADYNEAIMELGALICKPTSPLCKQCPVAQFCACQLKKLDTARIPFFKKNTYIKKEITRILCYDETFILLKRTQTKRLHRIYELPFLQDIDCDISSQEIAKIRRSISRERIIETIVIPTKETKSRLLWYELSDILCKISIAELNDITLSGPHRKWINRYFSLTI